MASSGSPSRRPAPKRLTYTNDRHSKIPTYPMTNTLKTDISKKRTPKRTNYLKWPFYVILATLFSQTLLQPVHGNSDAIYTDMHKKLHHLEKVVNRIVQEGKMDLDIKEAYDKREKIIKARTARNAKIGEMFETWRSGEFQILDDYLTLRQKVPPILIEKMRTKWEQIRRPLNEHDGKFYSKHDLEEIQKKGDKYYTLLEFLKVTHVENLAFFKLLASKGNHYLYADPETEKMMNSYTGLYDYMYFMAGSKLLRQHMDAAEQYEGVVHNVHHHDHPAVVVPAKNKNLDHAEMINVRALNSIVNKLYARLEMEDYKRMRGLSEQPKIFEEAKSILNASKEMRYNYKYSSVDAKPTAEVEIQFGNELNEMMQVKRVEPEQMPEYLGELLFDKWVKKTKLGTINSEMNDDEKIMAEFEKATEKMKIGEEVASTDTGDLMKTNSKGKRKMEERE